MVRPPFRVCRRVRSLTVAALLAARVFAATDFIYSNKFDNVSAEVWLPDDAPVVRGVIVHAANYKLKPDDRWAEFRGDKSRAAWFPNRRVAFVWRAWQAKDSPVVLAASAADGSANLPPWSPKTARDLMVNPGVDFSVGVTIREEFSVKRIQFFEGDELLGEAGTAPWQFTWRKPAPGAPAVHAVWETSDGRKGAVNPALVVVRHERATIALRK
jgi:hypothetical protein